MDPRYKSRFNDRILAEALQRYSVKLEDAEPLDGFESFIYSLNRPAGPDPRELILRIGHGHRRPEHMVRGEVEWINYLAPHMGPENGIPARVAQAVLSTRGRLVEPLDDGQGEEFLATAFVRAYGRHPDGEMMRGEELPVNYGAMLGRMHALAGGFQPSSPEYIRPTSDEPEFAEAETLLPASESQGLAHYRELQQQVRQLPQNDPASFGMIHQDAHGGNFFVDDQGVITLFDFDDCCRSWFVNDIAIVLFYAVMWERDSAAFTRHFMTLFLTGYRREHRLDPAWLAEIPVFLKLREIELYAVIHRSFDVNNLTDRWVAGFMRGRKERIDARLPFVDFDFTSLAGLLR